MNKHIELEDKSTKKNSYALHLPCFLVGMKEAPAANNKRKNAHEGYIFFIK